MARQSLRYLTVALACWASGCATTGDPRAGGLFGWSETAARQRQEELRRSADQAWQDADREQSRTTELQGRQRAADDALADLKANLDRQLAQNAQLAIELDRLLQTKAARSTELAKARAQLDRNTHLRQEAAQGPAATGIDLLTEQNRRLRNEIRRLTLL